VHSCCDTFIRWYPDEIAGLARRQSSSNIDASELPRLRFFEECRLGLEDSCVTNKRLEQVKRRTLLGILMNEKGERLPGDS